MSLGVDGSKVGGPGWEVIVRGKEVSMATQGAAIKGTVTLKQSGEYLPSKTGWWGRGNQILILQVTWLCYSLASKQTWSNRKEHPSKFKVTPKAVQQVTTNLYCFDFDIAKI